LFPPQNYGDISANFVLALEWQTLKPDYNSQIKAAVYLLNHQDTLNPDEQSHDLYRNEQLDATNREFQLHIEPQIQQFRFSLWMPKHAAGLSAMLKGKKDTRLFSLFEAYHKIQALSTRRVGEHVRVTHDENGAK